MKLRLLRPHGRLPAGAVIDVVDADLVEARRLIALGVAAGGLPASVDAIEPTGGTVREAELQAEVARLRELVSTLRGELDQARRALSEALVVPPPQPPTEVEQPATGDEPIVLDRPTPPEGDPAWRRKPVVTLGVPASLKTLLLGAGIDTAGKLADGLESGAIVAINGIGEQKAEQLQQHVEALAAA